MYYKITNARENHNGFQYKDGLNVLQEPFNDDPHAHCCKGGLYFTDVKNIFLYLHYGVYLREIFLPTDNPDFKMVADIDKYRANMLVLGKRYNLSDVATIKMLIDNGANVNAGKSYVLKWSIHNGYTNIAQYLMGLDGLDKNRSQQAINDYVQQSNYDYKIMKTLKEIGADIDLHHNDDAMLMYYVDRNDLKSVQYLVEHGANIHARDEYALRYSARMGYADIVEYLIKEGADIHAFDNYALRWAQRKRENALLHPGSMTIAVRDFDRIIECLI